MVLKVLLKIIFAKKDELIEVTESWVKESKKHKGEMEKEKKMIKLLSGLDSEIEISLSLSDKKKSADSEVTTEEMPPPYSKFVIVMKSCAKIYLNLRNLIKQWKNGEKQKLLILIMIKVGKCIYGWKDKWDLI